MIYNDDYTNLDNHMFDVYQIDIYASINIIKKRYVNKIKHVAFNVYNINSSKQDYATFRERLDDEKKITSICIDFESKISFMNEFLLSKNSNLFDRLLIVLSITIRDVAKEKICD